MNQEQAFLADVIEHPDDDVPRLVFADWLEDNDQPDRAEFIRAQIERERLDVYDPRRLSLERREAELLELHQTAWLSRLRKRLSEWTFRRGLLDEAEVRVETLLTHADKLASHPIQTLRLRFQPGDVDRADAVAGCAALANVATLTLFGALTTTALRQLADSPVMPRLRHLDLRGTQLNDSAVEALAASRLAGQLESLDLSEIALTANAAECLARGTFARLTTLKLSSIRMGNAGVEALASSRRLPPLQVLDLSESGLDARAARALAGCSRLAGLRRLNLSGNTIGTSGAVALAGSKHLRRLERLQLRSSGIGRAGAEAMGVGGFLASMTCLELAGNDLGNAGLIALLASPPQRLEYLLLGTNELDDDALRALAAWPGLCSVRELNLYHNQVTAFGIRALIDSPHLRSLCYVNLEHNRLKDLGAEVLAVWPGLAGMRWLKLRRNGITEKGALALARSPHLHFLFALDLSDNKVGDVAKEAFASPPLRERIVQLAPLDEKEIHYYGPFTSHRPHG